MCWYYSRLQITEITVAHIISSWEISVRGELIRNKNFVIGSLIIIVVRHLGGEAQYSEHKGKLTLLESYDILVNQHNYFHCLTQKEVDF